MTNTILDPSTTFPALCDSVGLDVRLRKAVSRLGHRRPTLVQSKCLPLAISSGRDLLVRARTGSGKTLAYSLPALQKLLQQQQDERKGVSAVILVPARELCTQVYKVLKELTYYCDEVISVAMLSSIAKGKKRQQELDRQESTLRDRPDVIVATPAGVLTHIRSGALVLKDSVETLVVDEADLVLSFGYANDIAEIVKALPRICQSFLMSATLSPELDSLKRVVLNSPVVLKLEQDDGHQGSDENLKQFYLMLPQNDKNLVLFVFLKLGLLQGKGLFFVNSTDAGYRLKLFFEQFHIRSAVLNAELPARSRLNIIEEFNLSNIDYLIATDSSTDASEQDDDEKEDKKQKTRRAKDSEYGVSRGLDFRNVSFVVNVDFPPNPKSYAHRVGRTARGGAKGVAFSLVTPAEQEVLSLVQADQPTVPLAAASTEKMQAAAPQDDGKDEMDEDDDAPPPLTAPEQAQPIPLDFDLNQIEGFRYRVEDVSRAVTRSAVRETRAAELRAEILNSERLQSHFEENPADLQLLKHDRVAAPTRVQAHLKHVPDYLLPKGMQVANLNRKRKHRKRYDNKSGGARRSDNDPLQAFDGAGEANLDGVQDDDDPFAEYMDEDGDDEENESKRRKVEVPVEKARVYTSTKDSTGESTAGHLKWQKRHRKGKFGRRKKSKKDREPLGL